MKKDFYDKINDFYNKIADYREKLTQTGRQKQMEELIDVLKMIFSEAMNRMALVECLKKYK